MTDSRPGVRVTHGDREAPFGIRKKGSVRTSIIFIATIWFILN